MLLPFDFPLRDVGPLSRACMALSYSSFSEVALFVKQLPYARNADKTDLTCILNDKGGTCSTKHAFVKALADEYAFEGLDLVLGLFRMSGTNTPKVGGTLAQANLPYMPEAHNYLRYQGQIIDLTNARSAAADFDTELIKELIIQPNQITDFKVAFHKAYLAEWLQTNPQLPYNLDELWIIREQCIKDLSNPSLN